MSADEKSIRGIIQVEHEEANSSMTNGDLSTASENNMADSDSEEEVYTLEELTEICDDADAVLGAADPHNCSYSQGYMPRQALYACLTCNNPKDPEASRAGVCLACANKCHEGHTLVELYTKRNFRCDCGNRKFRGHACTLLASKDPENKGNSYNHNYDGVYCTCARPYPDVEFPENDSEMIQCIVCEDWFHDKHVFGNRTTADGVDSEVDVEMICTKCTQLCDFLQYYPELNIPLVAKKKEVVDVVGVAEEEVKVSGCAAGSDSTSASETPASAAPVAVTAPGAVKCNGTSLSADDTKAAPANNQKKTDTKGEVNCLIANKTKATFPQEHGTLWVEHWRKQLCQCDSCVNNYYKLGVGYITDESDTLTAYEAIGKTKLADEKQAEDVEIDNMWNKLPPVAKVEAMIGINEMKEHLREFMVKFNGKVVKRKDVEEFKEGLAAKRARRMEDFSGVPPSNCH